MAKAKQTVPTKAQALQNRTSQWLPSNDSNYALPAQKLTAIKNSKVNTKAMPVSKNVEKGELVRTPKGPYVGEQDSLSLSQGLREGVRDIVEGTKSLMGYKETPEQVASRLLPSVKLSKKR